MVKTAFDPRQPLREALGTVKYRHEGDKEILTYNFTVTDNDGSTLYIPLYLCEEVKSEDLPELPFIELGEYDVEYEPQDIIAATRKVEAYVTTHIYYTDTDNISAKDFGKKIKDVMHNLIRTNQSTTTGISFMNIEHESFEPETDGRRVVYHYTAIIYFLYYDLC